MSELLGQVEGDSNGPSLFPHQRKPFLLSVIKEVLQGFLRRCGGLTFWPLCLRTKCPCLCLARPPQPLQHADYPDWLAAAVGADLRCLRLRAGLSVYALALPGLIRPSHPQHRERAAKSRHENAGSPLPVPGHHAACRAGRRRRSVRVRGAFLFGMCAKNI